MPVPNYSWKQIGIDLVGPLACTEEGNKYIIVVTDYFTKWPEARAAPTKEAFHVANFLFDLFLRHGCGVFAIAFALHTALSHRVPDLEFDQAKMRSHLLKCLTNRRLVPFPTLEKRGFRHNHFPYLDITVFCTCLMPETYDDMIQCENCEEWYHMNCVGLSAPPKVSENWYCSLCRV